MPIQGRIAVGMAVLFVMLALGLPAALGLLMDVRPGTEMQRSVQKEAPRREGIEIPVFLTEQKTIEKVPLETYVRGVVAAEMPADFELEALKAQAIAARTYIIKRWLDGNTNGVPAKGALVTDSPEHQVYLSQQEIEDLPSADLEKLNRAVKETEGLILTYQHQPIEPAFFSTSNGYTENSEDYWGQYLPYLRSVPSPWDAKLSPKYRETVVFDADNLFARLGVNPASAVQGKKGLQVLETTEGHRVKKIRIGDHIFTGREVREKLGLNSTHFTFRMERGKAWVTTYGYGHGVGMSQWGANGMAKEGKTAPDILRHYYTGIGIDPLKDLLPYFQSEVSQIFPSY